MGFALEPLAQTADEVIKHLGRIESLDSAFGVLGGVLLTYLVRFLLKQVMTIEVAVSWQLVLITLVIGLIGGALGALYPAMKAAKLDAVEALSYE